MFKKLFLLMLGAGFGFGVSFWLMRFIRETVERYTPERVSHDLREGLRAFGKELGAAIREGREAMREREEQLRAEIEAPPVGGRVSATSPAASGTRRR